MLAYNTTFHFQLLRYKTLAKFLRIVKVGVKVALVLLARYNVQSNAARSMSVFAAIHSSQ